LYGHLVLIESPADGIEVHQSKRLASAHSVDGVSVPSGGRARILPP